MQKLNKTSLNNKTFAVFFIFILISNISHIVFAQEGIIASCYYREKDALQKMWAAKKKGDKNEVASISKSLKNFLKDKQEWAQNLIKITDSTIDKVRNDKNIKLTKEELSAKLLEIENIKGEIRALNLQLEYAHLYFLKQNYVDRLDISENEKAIRLNKKSAQEQIANHKKDIVEGRKRITDIKNFGKKVIEDLKKSISESKDSKYKLQTQKQLKDIENLLKSGDYSSCPAGYSIKQYENWNVTSQRQLDVLVKQLQSGDYGEGYPINTYKDWIKHSLKALEDRKKQYVKGEWYNMRAVKKEIQQLKLRLYKLNNETGSSDEKILSMQKTKNELQKFLNHKFLTELPKEDSGFIKAIKWCAKAAKKVMDVADKVHEVRLVLDIFKSTSNPVHAFDLIYKHATGKSLYLSIAKKTFPSWITKSGAFQLFLETGRLDKKKVLEEFAAKNISKKLTKQYTDVMDSLKALKEDPKAFLKSRAYDKVKSIIDANPELKRSMKTFEDAKQFIDNPELIDIKLEESLKSYAGEKFKSTELYKEFKDNKEMLDKKVKELRERRNKIVKDAKERLNKIREDRLKDFNNFKNNVAKKAIENFGDIIKERVGLKDDDDLNYVEKLIRDYSFSTAK